MSNIEINYLSSDNSYIPLYPKTISANVSDLSPTVNDLISNYVTVNPKINTANINSLDSYVNNLISQSEEGKANIQIQKGNIFSTNINTSLQIQLRFIPNILMLSFATNFTQTNNLTYVTNNQIVSFFNSNIFEKTKFSFQGLVNNNFLKEFDNTSIYQRFSAYIKNDVLYIENNGVIFGIYNNTNLGNQENSFLVDGRYPIEFICLKLN